MTEQDEPAVENKPTPLIGRDQELAELVHMLKTMPPGSVAVVCGPAGVGKTRLVQEAVKQLEGPVEWVDGSESVVEAIATKHANGQQTSTFGINFEYDEEELSYWLSHEILIIVDNVDSANQQRDALRLNVASTSSRMLLISRDRAIGKGNKLLRVSLRPLGQDDSLRLLASEFRSYRSQEEHTQWSTLLHLVDGLPLAIRLSSLDILLSGRDDVRRSIQQINDGVDIWCRDAIDDLTFPGRPWRSLHESLNYSLSCAFSHMQKKDQTNRWKDLLGAMPTEWVSESVVTVVAGIKSETIEEFLQVAWRYGLLERDESRSEMVRIPVLYRNMLFRSNQRDDASPWVRLGAWLSTRLDPDVRPSVRRRHREELLRDWPAVRSWAETASLLKPWLLNATADLAIERGDSSKWLHALVKAIDGAKDESARVPLFPTAIRLALAAGLHDDAREFLTRLEEANPAALATTEGAELRRQVMGTAPPLLSPQQLELEEAASKLDQVGESALAAQLRAKARTLPSKPSEETNGIHPTAPIYLQQIELARWRGITELGPLPFNLPKDKDEGQWIFFLGENGAGKTSLLRAMALALAPDEAVDGILGDLGEQQPHVKAGADTASIRLTLEIAGAGPLPLAREIRRGDQGEQLATRPGGKRPFVVAYGCRRGSQTHSSAKEGNAAKEAILALFSESPTMMDVENWIQLRELDAQKDRENKGSEGAVVAAVKAALKKLLRLENIEITGRGLKVSGAEVGSVPFSALSDGYRTTAGWALDMMARWLDHARRQNLTLDGDICAEMTGVALVDDIDLHLHPRWQRDLVRDLRAQFPKMSFVVTTHNPLTLLGAKLGEVHVVTRDDDASVRVRQVDVPPGVGVERLLTGAWFGLDSVIDDETLGLLARRRKLLLEPDRDQAELDRLDGILRERLWRHDLTSLERIGEEAAASVLAELATPPQDGAPKKLGPAKRESALNRIKAEIRRREASTETG